MNTEKETSQKPQNPVKVKLDVIFKILFSEHKDLLQGLLEGLLNLTDGSIKSISLKNTELLPDEFSGKIVRMDVNVNVDDKLVNIEMQYSTDVNYKDRTLYYWAKLYSGELRSGDDYEKLKQSICINIVSQQLFDCNAFHSHFAMMESNRHETLTDKCSIHFFELCKISKTVDIETLLSGIGRFIGRGSPSMRTEVTQEALPQGVTSKEELMQLLWLQLINAETEEELNRLYETGVEPIQKAVRVVREMSDNVEIREMARMREKALHDEVSALNCARREGAEQARQELAPIIAEKDAELAALKAQLEELKAQLEKQKPT